MKSYRITRRMQEAAEARRNSLINIDMRGASPTAYGRSALILHAIYPQLPLRHVTGEDGMTRPMVTDIPQKIILEVCRRYRLVEATAHVISNALL
ncbi:hypothetical protein EII33_07095 [Bacteroides heparinolyticus]|uniref:Uncharacterized protein n=1 Tax=Prevotella heparinolytica TaxID=28113 RepID=A0A3P2ACQ8_9BACE|nr:hypothetical protein [Bacteroides heparinolyticus]RRD91423.1 hypothetical protein EII33_07095 [Bacteroides heparinolyticus]